MRRSILRLALLLVVALGGAAAARAATAPPRPALLGFQSESDPPALVTRDASRLTSVGVDGLNLSGRPGAVSAPDPAQRAQLRAARRAGLPAVLLVGNFSEAIDDFSEPLAWRTLRSPPATSRLAATLAGDVSRGGWSGISIDLESLLPRDATGLTELVADLRADLGAAASITVCVESSTQTDGYAADGYALRALAGSASQLVLMAYDEHGPWEATPGPVGAQAWVTAALRALRRVVPAADIDLGVAAYGYEWGPHVRRQLSDAAARSLVRRSGASARWVPAVGEWTAHLRGGDVIWWSDGRTRALRERLALRLGLHGLALWSLGLAGAL